MISERTALVALAVALVTLGVEPIYADSIVSNFEGAPFELREFIERDNDGVYNIRTRAAWETGLEGDCHFVHLVDAITIAGPDADSLLLCSGSPFAPGTERVVFVYSTERYMPSDVAATRRAIVERAPGQAIDESARMTIVKPNWWFRSYVIVTSGDTESRYVVLPEPLVTVSPDCLARTETVVTTFSEPPERHEQILNHVHWRCLVSDEP